MNEKVLKYLYDIKFAIDEIDSYFLNRERRFEDYTKDTILKRAIDTIMHSAQHVVKNIGADDSIARFLISI